MAPHNVCRGPLQVFRQPLLAAGDTCCGLPDARRGVRQGQSLGPSRRERGARRSAMFAGTGRVARRALSDPRHVMLSPASSRGARPCSSLACALDRLRSHHDHSRPTRSHFLPLLSSSLSFNLCLPGLLRFFRSFCFVPRPQLTLRLFHSSREAPKRVKKKCRGAR